MGAWRRAAAAAGCRSASLHMQRCTCACLKLQHAAAGKEACAATAAGSKHTRAAAAGMQLQRRSGGGTGCRPRAASQPSQHGSHLHANNQQHAAGCCANFHACTRRGSNLCLPTPPRSAGLGGRTARSIPSVPTQQQQPTLTQHALPPCALPCRRLTASGSSAMPRPRAASTWSPRPSWCLW